VSVELAIYRTDDYVPDMRIPILPLLKEVFGPLLGRTLVGCRFRLQFLPVADTDPLPGRPQLVNLRSSHGYLYVQITDGYQVLYRHPHLVREVVGRPLQRMLAEHDPAETHWGYSIEGPGLEAIRLVRPTPEVIGEMQVAHQPDRPQLFSLHEMEPEPPPLLSLRDHGLSAAISQHPVSVLFSPEVYEAFTSTMVVDEDVEDGGFLAGRVHRDAEDPERFIVDVTTIMQAERTGASLLHFTFTGESFLRVGELLSRRGSEEQLVGWYHTHLFPASDEFGLSSIDVELHTSTFRLPWQIAALVNLSGEGRTLRCYAMQDGELTQVGYVVRP
jgi:hypothetical protein